MESKNTFRITTFLGAVLVVIVVFIARLYSVQVAQAQTVSSGGSNYTFYTQVSASRGNIYDRNGVVLVSNRASYNLTVNDYIIYSQENTN